MFPNLMFILLLIIFVLEFNIANFIFLGKGISQKRFVESEINVGKLSAHANGRKSYKRLF